MSYGRGDHELAVKMLAEAFPSYPTENITVGTKEY